MGLTRSQGLEAMLGGMQGNNPYAEGDQARKTDQLRAYLQQKGQEAALKRNTEAAQNLFDTNKGKGGGAAEVSDSGVKISDKQFNPYQYTHQQVNGDAAARMKANQTYNAGLPKIQQVAQAAAEGLEAANDPQNMGSLGQARTLMLKAMGMNRYNNDEAKAVLPPTLYSYAATLFNQGGDDASPLNTVQRSNVNQFFKGQLDMAQSQHKMLKQNAMNMYTSSPYASDVGMQAMSGLGAPMEAMFQHASDKYKAIPQTQGPNLTSAPNPGPLDKLMGFFGGGKSAQPQQQQQAPQSGPHGDSVVQDGVTYKWNSQTKNYE